MALGPPDKFGLPAFYPPKVNGWSWFMDDDPEDQDGVDWPDEMDFLGGGLVRMTPNGPTDWGIGKYAKTFSDSIGGCNMDFAATAARGYGYKPDDARDIEYKALLSFDDIDPDNGFSISCCTGHHSNDGCCQGYAYMGNLRPATNPCPFRFRKEVTHPNYTSLDFFDHPKVNFALNGHGFIGFGFCRYNTPGSNNTRVTLEIWFNIHPESQPLDWFLVKQMEDFPGLGFCDSSEQGKCNGDDDQIGPWSNAQNRMKTNSTSGTVLAKSMSLIEIDPTGSFENPGGGGGGGGTTSREVFLVYSVIVYEPSAVGHTDLQDMTATVSEELIESQTDPYIGANSASFDGDPGGWYGVSVDGSDPIRDIGDTPCDGSGIFYAYADGLGVDAYWSNSKNRCTVPGRGDSDQGNSTAVSYHGGRVMKNPVIYAIFWGANWPSPSGGPTQSQIVADLRDKLLNSDKQFFDDINQYSGCGVPTWGDDINLNVASIPPATSEPEDAFAYIFDNKLLPVPATKTADVFYLFFPDNTFTSTEFAGYHTATKLTITETTTGGGGGTPGGGGPGGDPGSPSQLQGTFKFMWDINIIRVSSCAGTDTTEGGGGGGGGGTAKVYEVTDTSNTKHISDDSSESNRTRIAEKINTSSSALVGITAKQLNIPVVKFGSPGASPVINAKIWNSSGAEIYASPTTFAPNALGTTFDATAIKVFDFTTNTHPFAVGDKIGLEYTGTVASNDIMIGYSTSEGTGSTGSYVQHYEGTTWENQTSRRLACTIFQ